MTSALFAYPDKARREGKPAVPKNSIYAKARPTRRIRDLFVAQVDQIHWPYWLKPDTINLPATPRAPLINILALHLRTDDLDYAILACIDKAIPAPVIFELSHNGRCRTVAAYKRPSEADHAKWVVGDYFATDWLPADAPRSPLPVALDLAALYEQMLQSMIPWPARPGEALRDHVERVARVRQLERQCDQVEKAMKRERQTNRKFEWFDQLREIKRELTRLTTGDG